MYRLSQIEKDEITETIKLIIKELYDLWESSHLNEIVIKVKFNSKEKMDTTAISRIGYLHIYKDSLNFSRKRNCSPNFSWMEDGKYIVSDSDDEFLADLEIIQNYEQIKKKVLKVISLNNNNIDLKAIQSIKESIRKERKEREKSFIELDFPISNSKQKIEVKHEDDRTVGIIDFGDKIIKIVTDSDIVLVNKEKDKQKRK